MKYDFTTQSQAVKEAKDLIIKMQGYESGLSEQLECASKTLASLNMTKDLVDKGREEYFNSNYQIFNTYMETDSLLVENSLKETFLKQSYDEIAKAHARIKELEMALKDIIVMAREFMWEDDANWQKVTNAESLIKQD